MKTLRWQMAAAVDAVYLRYLEIAGSYPATIFMFHSIRDERLAFCTGELVPPPHSALTLERFLRWIARHARVVALPEIVPHVLAGGASESLAAITFDDGMRDNYTTAYPLLEQYGCKATFFVTCGMLSNPNGMTPSMVRELADRGMTIGSHTISHPHLVRIGADNARREIIDSQHQLSDITGHACKCFSYPYGDLNQQLKQQVEQAGYDCAVAATEFTIPGDRYELRRVSLPVQPSEYSFRASLFGAKQWRRYLPQPAAL